MKKSTAILLTVLMIFAVIPFSALPASANETEGIFTYFEYNGEATLVGIDPEAEGCIVVPSTLGGYPVTTVGYYAFYICENVTSVILPESVTEIGYYAFFCCLGLEYVYIPNSVTTIGSRAFSDCSAMTSIDIPDSVTSIGSYAFYCCSALESINIPESVRSIGSYAFYGCKALNEISIPHGIASIGEKVLDDTAYYRNTANWEGGVLYSGEYALAASSYLPAALDIRPGTTLIADSTFYSHTEIASVTLPNSLKRVGGSAFYNCTSLGAVDISSMDAWLGIKFADSLSSPLYYAHALYLNGALVTSVDIPSGISSIGDYAFENCTALKSITIPDSVTSIGREAFFGTAYYRDESNWTELVLYINDHLICARAGIEGEYAVRPGTKTIASNAFFDCAALKAVTVPYSVVTIGDHAFCSCRSLEAVDICYGVKRIEEYAFSGCRSLTSIVIPRSVESLGKYTFNYCTALTTVTATNPGLLLDGAFVKCSKLQTIRAPRLSEAHIYALENSLSFVELPADEHIFGEWIVVAEPTCTADGKMLRICTLCGIDEEQPVPAKGHGWSAVITAKAPTCTESGIDVRICHICEASETRVIPALGHELGEWEIVTEPTATANGLKKRTCTRCDACETQVIPALGEDIPNDGISVQNYTITLKNAANMTNMRYARGSHTTASAIKNATDCVTLNQSVIAANLAGDALVYDLPDGGIYSIWCRYADGSERIFTAVDVTYMTQEVEMNGAMFRICNLYGVADFFVTKGIYNTYRDVKNNYFLGITSARYGSKHTYAYGECLPGAGEYTVCVRYTDTSRPDSFIHFTVDPPQHPYTPKDLYLS